MTHSELVEKASRWLRRKHVVVITEMASQSEEPDAIGFSLGFSTVIECKASRGDFFADRKKNLRRMGDKRYFLTPWELVRAEECPAGWGLLYANGAGIHVVLEAPQNEDKNWRAEQRLMLSCIRRIGKTCPPGVSVRYYTYTTKNRATLGVMEDGNGVIQ